MEWGVLGPHLRYTLERKKIQIIIGLDYTNFGLQLMFSVSFLSIFEDLMHKISPVHKYDNWFTSHYYL